MTEGDVEMTEKTLRAMAEKLEAARGRIGRERDKLADLLAEVEALYESADMAPDNLHDAAQSIETAADDLSRFA